MASMHMRRHISREGRSRVREAIGKIVRRNRYERDAPAEAAGPPPPNASEEPTTLEPRPPGARLSRVVPVIDERP
jgi:hypothetical protein